mgnify:CR=1 FL=1
MARIDIDGSSLKVGDLVRFRYDKRWTGSVKDWGFGLIEEEYSDGTFEVYWPSLVGSVMTTRTLGKKALEVINESR